MCVIACAHASAWATSLMHVKHYMCHFCLWHFLLGPFYNFEIIDQVFRKVVDKYCSINYTSSNQLKMHLDTCFNSLIRCSTKKVLGKFIEITLFRDCFPVKLLYDCRNGPWGCLVKSIF